MKRFPGAIESKDSVKGYANAPADNITLNDPFVDAAPFKATYSLRDTPNMSSLLSNEYGRMWTSEHEQYVKERVRKPENAKFIKPDLYARKKIAKQPEVVPSEPVIKNQKYENVKCRVDNGK